jgi:hypothetical protein
MDGIEAGSGLCQGTVADMTAARGDREDFVKIRERLMLANGLQRLRETTIILMLNARL